MSEPLFPIILSPKEEVAAYAKLPVPLDGGFVPVAITQYRCANLAFGKDPKHHGTQDAVKIKDQLIQKSGRKVLKAMSPQEYVGVFLGKGSRRNIITVLQWADRCKMLGKGPKQAALQKFADDYIGLDCNGFAGNWASENCVQGIGPSTPPSGMGHAFRKNKRKSLEEIQPYDLFVWHEHVATVESIGPVVGGKHPHRVAVVAESYGAIMCRERIITTASSKDRFHVGGHNWASAEAFGIGLGPAFPPFEAIKAAVGAVGLMAGAAMH